MRYETGFTSKHAIMQIPFHLNLNAAFFVLLLLVLVACEQEDMVEPSSPAPDINNNQGYFVARAGEDRSILTGDTVNLTAQFARNQRNNSFQWRFLEIPPNSDAVISNPENITISFQADQPGSYLLELGMFFEQFSSYDTIRVSAFTITDLQGSYRDPTSGANGIIRQFLAFNDKLYAIGDFTQIGGVDAFGFASYDGNQWTGLGADLEMDQVYGIVAFQDKLIISGSSREVAADGVIKYVSWDDGVQQILGFVEQGSALAVFKDAVYMNFNNRLARWDGADITYPDMPSVETIAHIEVINDLLYLRGYSNEQCVNSTENVWIYNCEARGYLWEFDGSNWNDFNSMEQSSCLNVGSINWDYHIWIDVEPDFRWDIMEGYQGKVYFHCGYTDSGTFTEISYPFENINTLQAGRTGDLYISGHNQKTGEYTGIMKWDGQQWYTLGEGVEGDILTIEEYRGELFIGGNFNRLVGESQTNYTVWDGR